MIELLSYHRIIKHSKPQDARLVVLCCRWAAVIAMVGIESWISLGLVESILSRSAEELSVIETVGGIEHSFYINNYHELFSYSEGQYKLL